MRTFIVGSIENFEIEGEFPIVLNNSLGIHFNKHYIQESFSTPEFISTIGLIQHEELLEFPCYHCVLKTNDDNDYEPKQLVSNTNGMMQLFQLSLWFVKDNSVNLGMVYYHDPIKRKSTMTRNLYSYSTSNGEYRNISFSMGEIEAALSWFAILKKYYFLKNEEMKGIGEKNNPRKFIPHREYDRIGRAIIFINNARCDSFLPSKVASYISAIEALVSSDKEGLTSQVSERSAMFIGGNRSEKLDTYTAIRNAYKARSTYVHGDKLSESINKSIEEIAIKTDGILRSLITKIIVDFPEIAELKAEKFTDWYRENMLFSGK